MGAMPVAQFDHQRQPDTDGARLAAPRSKGKTAGWLILTTGLVAVVAGTVYLATTGDDAPETASSQPTADSDGGAPTDEAPPAASPTWSFPGDADPDLVGKPPLPVLSGTKAQTVTAGAALSVHVPANALDRDRDLSLERLDEATQEELVAALPYDNMLLFDAYEFHAGLEPGVAIPGAFEIAFDLSSTELDPVLYDDVRVVRLGESADDRQILASRLEGSVLKAESTRNSVIAFTILGVVYLSAVVYQNESAKAEMFGTAPYLSYTAKALNRYTFYWPRDLGFGNPDALRQVWGEEVDIFKAEGAIPEDYDAGPAIEQALQTFEAFSPMKIAIEHLDDDAGRSAQHTVLQVMNSPAYRALRQRCTPEWVEQNLLPRQVPLTIAAARLADAYLYTTRGFRAPSSVDVYISRKEADLGSSTNPALMNPYMTVKVLPASVVDTPSRPESKAVLDNYLVTFTHELFHVTQSARYIYGVDWATNAWFWEATATVLENEAADAYKRAGAIESTFVTERHGYDEAYLRALGLTSYWGTLAGVQDALQNQGYMMGYFLLYLRDHCAALGGVGDGYLVRLMNAFRGSVQKPIYTIVEQTTNSAELFELEVKRYYLSRAEAIARRFGTAAGDATGVFHAWAAEKDIVLSAAAPVAELTPVKNPLASVIRPLAFKLDQGKYTKRGDVTLVIRRGVDAMQNNQDLPLQVGDGQFRFREFTQSRTQAFPDFGLNSFGYVQEIHLYSDGWLNDFARPYQVYILLKPEAPRLSFADGKLTIELPQLGPLGAKGLVEHFMVTVKDASNAVVLLLTDKDRVELKLGPGGSLTDLDAPELRKLIRPAMDKYLRAHPEARADLDARYGKGAVDKAIAGTKDLDIDLGSLSRAAEVLASAAGGAVDGEIAVSIQEVTTGDRPIYGPMSEVARLKVKAQPTAGVSITGTWTGKVQMSGETMTVDISGGDYGYQYKIRSSMYGDEVIFYGREKNDGTVAVIMAMPGQKLTGNEPTFTTLMKNSATELYLAAPPVTLRRK